MEDVAQAEREKAKRVVYAVVYGVGEWLTGSGVSSIASPLCTSFSGKERLGEILGVDASHAKELMTSFLGAFYLTYVIIIHVVHDTY